MVEAKEAQCQAVQTQLATLVRETLAAAGLEETLNPTPRTLNHKS